MWFHRQCECKTAPWTVPSVCGLLKGQTSYIFFCEFESTTSEISISVDSSLSHLKATGTLKHLPIFSWCTTADKQACQRGQDWGFREVLRLQHGSTLLSTKLSISVTEKDTEEIKAREIQHCKVQDCHLSPRYSKACQRPLDSIHPAHSSLFQTTVLSAS